MPTLDYQSGRQQVIQRSVLIVVLRIFWKPSRLHVILIKFITCCINVDEWLENILTFSKIFCNREHQENWMFSMNVYWKILVYIPNMKYIYFVIFYLIWRHSFSESYLNFSSRKQTIVSSIIYQFGIFLVIIVMIYKYLNLKEFTTKPVA